MLGNQRENVRKNKTRSVCFRLQSNEDVESNFEVNSTCLLGEAIERSGIKPRDGSLIYALDNNGTPLDNRLPISSVPNNLLLGPSDKISQVWGEKWANNLGEVNDFSKGCIVVPGLEIGEYSTIFIVSRKGKNKLNYGYKFSQFGDHYSQGNLVYVKAPISDDSIYLFNPKSGVEDIKFQYIHDDIDKIRGFWGCCEIISYKRKGRSQVRLREDITPVPKRFKPKNSNNQIIKASRQVEQISASLQKSKSKRKRKLKIKNYQSINDELMIGQGDIRYGSGQGKIRDEKALIFGSPSEKSGTKYGKLASMSRKNRSALVNLPGYRFGMSQLIKVPQTGRKIDLYHEKEMKNYSCTILQKPEFDLEELRGRWVVARLKRHIIYKRAFEIIGLPNDFS
jgi:hypothetical protein